MSAPTARRRWGRRLAIVLAGLVLLRLALGILLLPLVGWVASGLGWSVSADALRLRLHRGRLEVDGLVVRAPAGVRGVARIEPASDPAAAGSDAAEPHAEDGLAFAVGCESVLVDLDLSSLWGGRANVSAIELRGLALRLETDLAALLTSAVETPESAEEEPSGPATLPSLPVSVERLFVEGGAGWLERSLRPPLFQESGFRIEGESLGVVGEAGKLRFEATSPRLARSLSLELETLFEEERWTVELALDAEGVQAGTLERLLEPAGVFVVAEEHALRARGELALDEVEDGLDGAFVLRGLELTASGESVVSCDELSLSLASASEGSRRSWNVRGLELELGRAAQGAPRLAGIELRPPSAEGDARDEEERAAEAEVQAPDPGAAAEPLAWRDDLRVESVRIGFEDEATGESAELAVDELLLEDLALAAVEGIGVVPRAGRLSADLAASVGGELFARMGIRAHAEELAGVACELTVESPTSAPLAPWLRELGVAGGWEELALAGRARLAARERSFGLLLEDLDLRAAGEPVFALASADLPVVRDVAAGTLGLGDVRLEAPRLSLERRADGSLGAGGLTVVAATDVERDSDAPEGVGGRDGASGPGSTARPEVDAPREAAADARGGARPPAASPASATLARLLAGLPIRSLEVVEGSALWRDALVGAGGELAFAASVGLTAEGEDGRVLAASVELSGERLARRLALDSELRAAPGAAALEVDLEGVGLQGELVSRYLSGGALELEDGTLRARLEAELVEGADGVRARVRAGEVELAEGTERLARIGELELSLSRGAGEDAALVVERAHLGGIELEVRRRETGWAIGAWGVPDVPATAEPNEAGAGALPAPVAGAERSRSAVGVREASGTPAGSGGPSSPGGPGGPGLAILLPTEDGGLLVEELELALDRVRFLDERHAGAEPLELTFTFGAPEPFAIGGAEPAAPRLVGRGAVEPLLSSIDLDLLADLERFEPQVSLDLELGGLEGSSLSRFAPGLARQVDLTAFQGGALRAGADLILRSERRGLLDLGLGRGFGLDLSVEGVELVPSEGAEPLFSLEALHVDVARVAAASGFVHVRTIEVLEPRARLARTADGFEVCGVRVSASPEVEPEVEPKFEPEVEPEVGSEEPAETPAEERTGELTRNDGRREGAGEVRVDRLLLFASELELVDAAAEPHTPFPLEDLELELRGLSTRALEEESTISIELHVAGGDVELPERVRTDFVGGVVGGIFDTARSVIPGEGKEVALEERPFLGAFVAEGSMRLHPRPSGELRYDLTGLELAQFAAEARAAGFEIRDGLADSRATIGFGEQGMRVRSRTSLGHLAVSEEENGPVRRFLQLPMPLNTVVFLLRDEDGAIELALDFDVPSKGMSGARVAERATAAFGQLVTRAVANSPWRVTGTATDVLRRGGSALESVGNTVGLGRLFSFGRGLFGSDEEERRSAELVFAPGVLVASEASRGDVIGLVGALRKGERLVLEHVFGPADVERVERLANPSAEECRTLAEHLLQRRHSMEAERAGLSRRASELFAAGRVDEARPVAARLRGIEGELGDLARAIGALHERMRPGDERRAKRRTRSAALELAEERLARAAALVEGSAPELAARMRRVRPRFQVGLDEGGGRIRVLRVAPPGEAPGRATGGPTGGPTGGAAGEATVAEE